MTSRRDQDSQWRVPDGAGAAAPPPAVQGLDLAFRILGAVVALWGSVLLAIIEAFLVPLRLGGVRLPVSLLLAIVGNLAFIWFARYTTGSKLLALLPGLAWFVVTIVLSSQTSEGDTVLLGGDWMPLALLLFGAGSVAVGAYLFAAPRGRVTSSS